MAGYSAVQLHQFRHELHAATSPAAERDLLLFDATAVLVFATPSRHAESDGDAWLAAQSAVLFAETIPVATCFNATITVASSFSGAVRQALGLRRGQKAVAALTLGYPAHGFPRRVLRPAIPTTWL
jgi:hypothetical protein